MTCNQARQEMVSRVEGQIEPGLEVHLAGCAECRGEWENFGFLWKQMGALDDCEVRPEVTARFHDALHAYEQGMQSRSSAGPPWPWSPAFQIALSAACLCIGIFLGLKLNSSRSDLGELKREMSGMRQLVVLSLLQQQSASERLRGVTWANRTEANDMEVLSALLRTVNSDTNENVRLAAIDALRNFSSSPVARHGMVQSLAKQSSPLVQIALIDLLTDLITDGREPEAKAQLQTMLTRPGLDTLVKSRLERSLASIQ